MLPLALFCGGHNYFVAQMPQRRGVTPYSVHTTFQYGGAEGKRHRLREAAMWEDELSYYDPPGGMLRSTLHQLLHHRFLRPNTPPHLTTPLPRSPFSLRYVTSTSDAAPYPTHRPRHPIRLPPSHHPLPCLDCYSQV